jgi:hypothetical protein
VRDGGEDDGEGNKRKRERGFFVDSMRGKKE